MSKLFVKKGDMVVLIAGDDKGKTGKILKSFPKESKVIVEGCNLVKKTMKLSENNPKNNFLFKEQPIHVSNVKKI